MLYLFLVGLLARRAGASDAAAAKNCDSRDDSQSRQRYRSARTAAGGSKKGECNQGNALRGQAESVARAAGAGRQTAHRTERGTGRTSAIASASGSGSGSGSAPLFKTDSFQPLARALYNCS